MLALVERRVAVPGLPSAGRLRVSSPTPEQRVKRRRRMERVITSVTAEGRRGAYLHEACHRCEGSALIAGEVTMLRSAGRCQVDTGDKEESGCLLNCSETSWVLVPSEAALKKDRLTVWGPKDSEAPGCGGSAGDGGITGRFRKPRSGIDGVWRVVMGTEKHLPLIVNEKAAIYC